MSTTQPQELAAVPAKKSWRIAQLMVLLLVGSAVISFIVFRYVAPRVPRELVGTWQVTDGALKGAALEFRWYGTGIAAEVKDGKRAFIESSVRVRGKRIFMTYPAALASQEETIVQTIVSLTDDELVIRDQDQMMYHMIRIRD